MLSPIYLAEGATVIGVLAHDLEDARGRKSRLEEAVSVDEERIADYLVEIARLAGFIEELEAAIRLLGGES